MSNATPGNFPAVNPGALYFLPTEDQWYKAAYYKGGSTNAGYWDYATQSDTAPTAVTADLDGDGSGGIAANDANYNSAADWNGSGTGNVTTVGSNGRASPYGAFDMSGNVYEWNDLTGNGGANVQLRGGYFDSGSTQLESSDGSFITGPSTQEAASSGFRIAAVPEPSTWVMGLAGLACGGSFVRWRGKRA